MSGSILLPNQTGNPSCSEVEPMWFSVLTRGSLTPAQVISGDSILAELQYGQVFLQSTLLQTIGGVLVKNPYDNIPQRQFGVRNGIAQLSDGLIVVVSEANKYSGRWQIRREINWDNLNRSGDKNLLESSFLKFLHPLGSGRNEV